MSEMIDLKPDKYSINFEGNKQKIDASDYIIEIVFDSEPGMTNSQVWFVNKNEKKGKFGTIGLRIDRDHLRSKVLMYRNKWSLWDIDLLTDIEHEIGHAIFAIMRELFPDQWEAENESYEIDHILEEIFMQIYSDLVKQFRKKIQSGNQNE